MENGWADITVLSKILSCGVPHSGTLLNYPLIKLGYKSHDAIFSEAQNSS